MSENYNLFEMIYEPYKITKPIRLIELFGGVGSQSMALRNIGANFEHYRLVEFDKHPIASYNAIHGTNFEPKDITKIKAEDLGITETDKYEYIMTYSFPCQDLSVAGKQKGMAKGSGTRSGLLWEVERLLTECKELPQILLMENVPVVIGKKNISDFQKWEMFLEKLGYKNYVEILNAKDYGIPQNRRRCFMVSLLGEYCYTFPKKQKSKLRLKDMLEEKVDEKYYLSKKMIEGMKKTNFDSYKLENKLKDINGIANTIMARFEGAPQCIVVPENTKKGYAEAHEGDGVYINRPQQKRGVVQKGMIQTIKTSPDVGVVVASDITTVQKDSLVAEKGTLKIQLCDDLVKSGLVKEFDVVNHSYTNVLNCKNPNSRQKLEDYIETTDNSSPCLTTRPDTFGVVVGNYSPSDHNANPQRTTIDSATLVGAGEHRRDEGIRTFKDGVIGTLRTKDAGGDKVVVTNPPLTIRKLTPKECWRLMGFSDEDFEKAAKVNSNAQLYKQAGNSIVVNVLEAIFRQLL